jgi:hypothetical protein
MKFAFKNHVRLLNGVRRKIFVPNGITRMPKSRQSVISDLFFIRADNDWETSFELLNINALLLGSFERHEWHSAIMYFFDSDGNVIQELQIPMNSTPRSTLRINDMIQDFPKVPATFALFHSERESADLRGESLIAERGYVGYEFKGLGVKGYVHGNLDAVALSDNVVEPIGNSGVFKRHYTVQHLLFGAARYEFAFTNPTSKSQKISMEVSNVSNKWVKNSELVLKPLGSGIFEIDDFGNTNVVRFKSKLYLGRPIVFRTTPNSLDVFHG